MKKEFRTIRLNNYRNYMIACAEKALAKKNPPSKTAKEENLKKEGTKLYKARLKKMKFRTSDKRSRYSYNLEFKYACLKLWESGMTITSISKLFGVARSTLYRWKSKFKELFNALPLERFHDIKPVKRYKAPTIEVIMIPEPIEELAIAA